MRTASTRDQIEIMCLADLNRYPPPSRLPLIWNKQSHWKDESGNLKKNSSPRHNNCWTAFGWRAVAWCRVPLHPDKTKSTPHPICWFILPTFHCAIASSHLPDINTDNALILGRLRKIKGKRAVSDCLYRVAFFYEVKRKLVNRKKERKKA